MKYRILGLIAVVCLIISFVIIIHNDYSDSSDSPKINTSIKEEILR